MYREFFIIWIGGLYSQVWSFTWNLGCKWRWITCNSQWNSPHTLTIFQLHKWTVASLVSTPKVKQLLKIKQNALLRFTFNFPWKNMKHKKFIESGNLTKSEVVMDDTEVTGLSKIRVLILLTWSAFYFIIKFNFFLFFRGRGGGGGRDMTRIPGYCTTIIFLPANAHNEDDHCNEDKQYSGNSNVQSHL